MLGYSFVPIIAGYIRGRILYRLERSFARVCDRVTALYPAFEKLIVAISLGLFDYIDILERISKGIFRW